MKYTSIYFLLFIALICCNSGCSESEKWNESPFTATGTITLSGDDTSIFGNVLEANYLAIGTNSEEIMIVDQTQVVEAAQDGGFQITTTDPTKSHFNLMVTNEDIFVSITDNNLTHVYSCTTPVTYNVGCGLFSINLDINNRTLTLTQATVRSFDTDRILNLSGKITWTEN